MASPCKWELLLTNNNCQLDTVDTAVHAAIIYNPQTDEWKVLYFGFGTYRSYIWDPQNPTVVNGPQNFPPWPTSTINPELACSGHTFMEDGKLLVAGGSYFYTPSGCNDLVAAGIPYTYLFDPVNEEWLVAGTTQDPHEMNDGRFYPTVTILGDDPRSVLDPGSVIVMSGDRTETVNCVVVPNKDPQFYLPLTGWELFPNQSNAEQPFDDYYPTGHLVPFGDHAGKVFYPIPINQARMFNPFAEGTEEDPYWQDIGTESGIHRKDGCSVLFPILPGRASAKVMITGGDDPATDSVDIIDLMDSNPDWVGLAPMIHKRRNHIIVVLPDDNILVIGGNARFQLTNPVYAAEYYDTEANLWKPITAVMNRPRMYHSVALLQPDARVWVSGTDWGTFREKNIEIFSPDYLYDGDRPEITQAPANITYGSQFGIVTSDEIGSIRLIRLSSITHSINFEQRSVGLSYIVDPQSDQLLVEAPVNANIAPPGYYMLFVLKPKSASISGNNKIPSVAKIIKLSY